MKGIVFTEFLVMVENEFGYDTANQIIENSELKSKGVYTSVGTYDHHEMVQLVTNLSEEVDIPVQKLLLIYGEYFFKILVDSYPMFFESIDSAFSFLSSIENHIHVEVLKLYPDAELPHFDIDNSQEGKLSMTYHSDRKLHSFAEGLILGCIAHFKENISIKKELIEADGSVVNFLLSK